MRSAVSAVLVLSVVAASLADDASFCNSQCSKHFDQDTAIKACKTGCTKRGKVSDGARGFLACHEACQGEYNETLPADMPEGSERAACDYACSLPMTNVFMMKVDYGSENGEPKVQVMHKEGGDLFTSSEERDGFGDVDINKLLNAARVEMKSNEKEEGEDDVDDDDDDDDKKLKAASSEEDKTWPASPGLSNMFKIRTGDDDFDKMQERMNEMIRTFFSRAQKMSNVAKSRPSGHDGFSMGESVDNTDSDGRQILLVAPLNRENGGWVDLERFEMPRDAQMRHRFPALFQWTVCLVLLLAVACTLLVALLMARHLRLHRYSALRNMGVAGAPSAVVTTGMAAPELVKKVPIDTEESSLPEPSGVPPPAYDQLSVHSKRSSQ